MGLGIEEDLGMLDTVGCRSVKIGLHQLVEVLSRLEDGGSLVVDVEKRLEIGELVSLLHVANRLERELEAIALR